MYKCVWARIRVCRSPKIREASMLLSRAGMSSLNLVTPKVTAGDIGWVAITAPVTVLETVFSNREKVTGALYLMQIIIVNFNMKCCGNEIICDWVLMPKERNNKHINWLYQSVRNRDIFTSWCLTRNNISNIFHKPITQYRKTKLSLRLPPVPSMLELRSSSAKAFWLC